MVNNKKISLYYRRTPRMFIEFGGDSVGGRRMADLESS
jgi:hypothetical protein